MRAKKSLKTSKLSGIYLNIPYSILNDTRLSSSQIISAAINLEGVIKYGHDNYTPNQGKVTEIFGISHYTQRKNNQKLKSLKFIQIKERRKLLSDGKWMRIENSIKVNYSMMFLPLLKRMKGTIAFCLKKGYKIKKKATEWLLLNSRIVASFIADMIEFRTPQREKTHYEIDEEVMESLMMFQPMITLKKKSKLFSEMFGF